MSEDLLCQFAKYPHLRWLIELLEDAVYTLAFGVPNRAQPVASYGTGNGAWSIRHDEPESASADCANDRPESTCRTCVLALCQTLIPAMCQRLLRYTAAKRNLRHHLFECTAKLLIAELLCILLVLRLAAEPKCRPREASES